MSPVVGTVLALCLVVIVVFFALRSIIREHRQESCGSCGEGGCSGGCAGCSMSSSTPITIKRRNVGGGPKED